MQNSSAKRSLPIILAVILFIPLVVAIISGLNVDPYSLSAGNLKSVSITTNDNTYEFDDEASLELYADITVSTDKEIDSSLLESEYSDTKAYEVTYTQSNSDTLKYTIYLSSDDTGCLYKTPNEKYFIIDQKTASKLILREEFSEIDTSALLPNATVKGISGTVKLKASDYKWEYTALDGQQMTLSSSKKATNSEIIKFDDSKDGAIKLDFDKKPDILNITITDINGQVEYEGSYEELPEAGITYNRDKKMKFVANAEWLEKDTCEYHGTATYEFDILFDIVPTYHVVNGPLPVGDFTVLRMSDFNDGELLYIENEIGLENAIPVYDILDEENVKIAIIPYGYHLPWGASYELTLKTEAGQTDTVTVGTRAMNNNNEKFDVQEKIIIDTETSPGLDKACTQKALDEFNALVKELSANSVNEKLYDGQFLYPTGSSKVVSGGAKYGMTRSFKFPDMTYTAFGDDLEATLGQEIKAANSGKVVYAGETTFLGNTVIIDHGFSALTYYGNLESISVKVGDIVKKSDVVGKAGSTGFACAVSSVSGNRATLCHYAVSMNGIFVQPKRVAPGISYKK